MSYKELYNFAQGLDLYIKRNELKDEAVRLAGAGKITIVKSKMDVEVCRGMWIDARNEEHQFVRQTGGSVIVIARGMNRCWDRFVTIKELMHLFDDEDAKVGSPEEFEALMNDFTSPGASTESSPQLKAEIWAFWRALAVLCPEEKRLEFKAERASNNIDDYEIALRLRIPQQYVQNLFQPSYERRLGKLLE